MNFQNNNDKQVYFNHTKGLLIEVFKGDAFCHLTIEAGHEKKRFINITFSVDKYDTVINSAQIGDKVCVKYYPASYKKYEKWKTILHLLNIEKIVTFV
jgi:hypothetical protein